MKAKKKNVYEVQADGTDRAWLLLLSAPMLWHVAVWHCRLGEIKCIYNEMNELHEHQNTRSLFGAYALPCVYDQLNGREPVDPDQRCGFSCLLNIIDRLVSLCLAVPWK
jgi:hypothetical protein